MYAIEMQGITKTFHGSYANKEVSLKVEQGEIHSLLGENGAGKTTLMKILFGLYKADKGRILINGSPAAIRSPHDAIDYGISMVHQHFVLVGNLTITENIILGHEPRKGILLDRGKARQKVDALIRRYHFDLNPESRIENLSVGEKQRVEILKALYNESSIILLDEPTAVLTPQEVQELFAMLRQLKRTAGPSSLLPTSLRRPWPLRITSPYSAGERTSPPFRLPRPQKTSWLSSW